MSTGPRDRTTITRLGAKARDDRVQLDDLLDRTIVGHVGLLMDPRRPGAAEAPLVIPTAVVRDGDRVLMHGSTGSGWMRRAAAGAEICLAVTAFDGLVIARSAFESSIHYRSAVLFGSVTTIAGADKARALDLITERLLPGRAAEIRPSSSAELAATLVLALPIVEWSLKVSDGWPEDPPQDVAGPAWAGVVPRLISYGPPRATPDLATGIAVPESVRRLVES